MALKNLALTTLNADGTSSIYGAQGNAIEDTTSTGVMIFADPLAADEAPAVPIWYAPDNSGQDFQSILNNQTLFQTVAGDIKVFKLYGYLASWTDASLKAFFAYASSLGIKLGVEAPALVADVGQLGYGVEGFGTPGALVYFLNRIKSLGGTLSYIAWDEPWYFGSGINSFYTTAQIASQVAAAATTVRAYFPNIQIGDTEPVGGAVSTAPALQAWFTAYTKAAGTPFTTFQADVKTWVPGWQTTLAATIVAAHAGGTTVGVIINGLNATTDASWAAQAVANSALILSTPALRPDFLVVQSWQVYPSETADPTVAGTLASVAADVAAGEAAALSVPAVAQYNAAGLLQSVAWTGGWQAVRTSSAFEVLSPTGAVVTQIAWSQIETFAFDPNTATVALSYLVPTSAVGAIPTWRSESFSVGVGANGVQFNAPVTSGSALTLALAGSSLTGFPGSGITNHAMPTLAGTAAPNAVIALRVDGTSLGNVTASNTGAWSYTFASTLSNGAHDVQAAYTDGTTHATVQQTYALSVDTLKPKATTLTLTAGSDSGYPGDDITDVTQPVLAGVADPDTTVALVIDGKAVGTVVSDLGGAWSYDANDALAVGTHTVTATAINAAGTRAVAATMQLTVDTAALEAAVTSPDPLFDTAWYLQNHPQVAAAGGDAYTQFMTVGWKLGFDPDPFFSTSYYLNTYADVAAAGVNPLTHFEQYGWKEGRNPDVGENTNALEKSLPGLPAGEDPLIAYIQSFRYSDAIVSAVPHSQLKLLLLHDTGASSTDGLTDDPTLAVTADPGATLTFSVGTAGATSFTAGSTGSWSYGYAAASLVDGAYAVTVTEAEPGGGSSVATLDFTLDRTPPVITAMHAAATAATVKAAEVVMITLNMSKTVRVTGLPALALNNGGVAQYVSGSGTTALTFDYTVPAGLSTSALAVAGVKLLSGASISDAAGNAANLVGSSILTGPLVIQAPAAGGSGALIAPPVVTLGAKVGGSTAQNTGAASTAAHALSSTQVGSYTSTDLPGLSRALVTLSSLQAAAQTTTGVSGLLGLAKLEFMALEPAAIQALTSTQVGALPTAVLSGLSGRQLAAIASTAIPGLTSSDVLGFSSTQIGALTSAQIPAIDPHALSAAVAGGFSPRAFSDQQIAVMTRLERAALFG